jgi:uncharacterized heparinase superfamily protein
MTRRRGRPSCMRRIPDTSASASGSTTVIADTGAPPPVDVSPGAHAGCLAFEMSAARESLIVNSGIDSYGADEFRPLARATAAHSTAVISTTRSSARFHLRRASRASSAAPLIGGPQRVRCERIDKGGMQGFVARHDGYVGPLRHLARAGG